MRADSENARVAWDWAVERGLVARLDQALEGLCLIYERRGRHLDGESTCRIAADKLVVLADPKGALPSYDALLLLSPRIADDPGIAAALQPLLGAISVEAMREANFAVDREDAGKLTPKQAAEMLSRELRRPGLDPGPLSSGR